MYPIYFCTIHHKKSKLWLINKIHGSHREPIAVWSLIRECFSINYCCMDIQAFCNSIIVLTELLSDSQHIHGRCVWWSIFFSVFRHIFSAPEDLVVKYYNVAQRILCSCRCQAIRRLLEVQLNRTLHGLVSFRRGKAIYFLFYFMCST